MVQINAEQMNEFKKLYNKVIRSISKFKQEKTILSLALVFEYYLDWHTRFISAIYTYDFSGLKVDLENMGLKLENFIEKELKSFCDNKFILDKAYDALYLEYLERCENSEELKSHHHNIPIRKSHNKFVNVEKMF